MRAESDSKPPAPISACFPLPANLGTLFCVGGDTPINLICKKKVNFCSVQMPVDRKKSSSVYKKLDRFALLQQTVVEVQACLSQTRGRDTALRKRMVSTELCWPGREVGLFLLTWQRSS